MAEVKEKTLDVSGFKIAYTDTGPEDGRIVFCAHALLSNSRDHDFLAHHLAEQGYRIIAMDLPGRGKSDRFDDYTLYSLPNYIPYCIALILHVTEGKPFDWFGVSLGGMLGMSLNGIEQLPMERLIVVDIGAEIPAEALNYTASLAKVPSTFNTREDAIAGLKKRCSMWGIRDQKIWDHLVANDIVENEDGTFSFHYDEGIGRALSDKNETLEFWATWEHIKQPVLLIRGEQSVIFPEDIAEEMQERYMGEYVDFVEFENCGHIPNMMQKDHIEAVSDWLDQ